MSLDDRTPHAASSQTGSSARDADETKRGEQEEEEAQPVCLTGGLQTLCADG
jgi:hypothetical protein